ncbi:hypothetical protein Tco_0811938 [Tanacetum coccineum]
MINKAPLEDKQKVVKEFLDLRKGKIDELILPGEDEMRIMNVTFRALPYGIDLYTRLGTGLLGLVNKCSKQVLIEAITFYKGEFTRIMVLVCLGYGCTIWYTAVPEVYGMALPTELFPPDATYVDFFRDKVTIPSDESSTSQIASSSANTSQIGSSSASTSQMTNPDIGSTSEVSGSDNPARRLSENQRSAIKLAVMMSIFVASGVLMKYSTKIDKSIGSLLENIEDVYNDLIESGCPFISKKEFHSQQQLVLSGFYELSPFRIRFLNAKGVSDFLNRRECHLFRITNDPYGDEESKSYMISSTAIKDELVLRGLYSLRIRSPLLGSAISRSRILEIVKLYVDDDSISFRLAKDFLYNRYQNEKGERNRDTEQQLAEQRYVKENSLNKLNALKSTTQLLKNQSIWYQQAFARLFGDRFQEPSSFSYLNTRIYFETSLLNAETLHEMDSKSALSVIKVQFERFINSDLLKPLDIYSRSFSSDREVIEIFRDYTKMTAQTFKETIIQNMNSIEQCIIERASHEQELKMTLKNSGDKTSSGIVSDEEIEKKELEAHYGFMANIQEVLHGESSSTDTPLEQVQNNDENNVFANERQHYEKNAAECTDERVALANLIANLTLDNEGKQNTFKALKESKRIIDLRNEKVKLNLDED